MKGIEYKSYGIIPIFKGKDGFYILIVKNSKGGHWGLPKGTPKKGEKPINTAKRELFEETNIKDIDTKTEITFRQNYDFIKNNVLYNKTVIYYPGFISKIIKGNKLDEIDELRWVKIGDALNTITYKSTSDVVEKLMDWLVC